MDIQRKLLSWRGILFSSVLRHDSNLSVGKDFMALFEHAAVASEPERVIHLCYIDRVAFALQSEYRAAFVADLQALTLNDTPIIFQRSERAWGTHPANYRAVEGMVSTVGELLFGRSLDFAWCHLALQAKRLMEIVPQVKIRDNGISFVAEIVLALRHDVQTKEVDWLAWEDPFMMGMGCKGSKTSQGKQP